jgi:hypothetical protein
LGEDTRQVAGGWRVTKLRSDAPGPRNMTPPPRIAWLGCGGDPPTGIYQPAGLAVRVPAQRLREDQVASDTRSALRDVDAIVLRPSCDYAAKARPAIESQFDLHCTAGDVGLWTRKPGATITASML